MSAPGSRPKLIVILGSHACRAGMLLLEHKGIEYTTTRIPSGTQRLLRVRGWPGGTVPALVMDGERVQGNREIARHLDRVQPEPPLFPADPDRRREVEEAERWADEVFQMSARRIALAATLDGLDSFSERADRGRLGPLLWTTQRRRKVGMKVVRRVFNVNRRTEPRLMRKLPGQLDRIDAWIEAGVLNGEQLNAADYEIAPSLALLMYRHDLRPDIEARPAAALADRILPEPAAFAAA